GELVRRALQQLGRPQAVAGGREAGGRRSPERLSAGEVAGGDLFLAIVVERRRLGWEVRTRRDPPPGAAREGPGRPPRSVQPAQDDGPPIGLLELDFHEVVGRVDAAAPRAGAGCGRGVTRPGEDLVSRLQAGLLGGIPCLDRLDDNAVRLLDGDGTARWRLRHRGAGTEGQRDENPEGHLYRQSPNSSKAAQWKGWGEPDLPRIWSTCAARRA